LCKYSVLLEHDAASRSKWSLMFQRYIMPYLQGSNISQNSVTKNHTPNEKNFQQWPCLRTFSECGIFPDRLNAAKVKPLYEGEAIHDVQKYKPISFLLSL